MSWPTGPLQVPEREGVTLIMPAYLSASGGMGAKVVSVFPQNAELGLPTAFDWTARVEVGGEVYSPFPESGHLSLTP